MNNKNYYDLLDELTIEGFFSEYLPPCFYFNDVLLIMPSKNNVDPIEPYSYSMSRFDKNDRRRFISIPEVKSYLDLYKFIKDNNLLEELDYLSSNNSVSFSPIIDNDGKILKHEQIYHKLNLNNCDFSLYINNVSKKIKISAGAKKVIHLDISNCYSSFYTHMIPTIFMGYDSANKHYLAYKRGEKNFINSPECNLKYLIYNKFDKVVRNQNNQKTNGLLIGPQYSRIIIEGILCRIDMELSEFYPNIKYTRYIDDYDIYLFDGQNEEEVISIFSKVLKKYNFSINYEKTEVVDFPFYIISNLQKIYDEHIESKMTNVDLMELFNKFLTMEQNGQKGSIRFMLKKLENMTINIEDKEMYKAYLLDILTNNPRSFIKSCSLLNGKDIVLTEKDTSLLKNILKFNIKENHDLEVIWLIYLLINKNKIDNEDKENIIASNNELAHLLLLRNNILSENEIKIISEKCSSWILAYELFAMDRITESELKQKLSINIGINFYKNIKKNNITFCKKIV